MPGVGEVGKSHVDESFYIWSDIKLVVHFSYGMRTIELSLATAFALRCDALCYGLSMGDVWWVMKLEWRTINKPEIVI